MSQCIPAGKGSPNDEEKHGNPKTANLRRAGASKGGIRGHHPGQDLFPTYGTAPGWASARQTLTPVPHSLRRSSFGHCWGFPGHKGPQRDPPQSGRSVGCRGWRRRAWRPAAPEVPAPSARPCRPGPPRRAVPTKGTRQGHGARPAAPACLGTHTVRTGRRAPAAPTLCTPRFLLHPPNCCKLFFLTKKHPSALLGRFEKCNISPFQSPFSGSASLQRGHFARRWVVQVHVLPQCAAHVSEWGVQPWHPAVG